MSARYGSRIEHSSYLSLAHKYLYIETPKAACTTIKQLIATVENIPTEGFRDSLALDSKIPMLIHDRSLFSMPTLSNVSPLSAEEALESDEYFRFCFVRNPYSRLFSAWQSKILLHEPFFIVNFDGQRLRDFSRATSWEDIRQSFGRFIHHLYQTEYPTFSNPHWAPQCDLIFKSKIRYTLIGRTDAFETDIQAFLTHLASRGVQTQALSLPKSNPGLFRDWRWFYTEETAAMVHSMYKADFDELELNHELKVSDADRPQDADHVNIKDWADEVVARNEMIVLLRSRLIQQIHETLRLKAELASLQPNYLNVIRTPPGRETIVTAQPKSDSQRLVSHFFALALNLILQMGRKLRRMIAR